MIQAYWSKRNLLDASWPREMDGSALQMQSLSGLKKLVKSIFQVWPSLRGWDSEPKIFDFLDSVSLPLFSNDGKE